MTLRSMATAPGVAGGRVGREEVADHALLEHDGALRRLEQLPLPARIRIRPCYAN